MRLSQGNMVDEQELKQRLVALQYQRNDQNFSCAFAFAAMWWKFSPLT